jgi:hypothetical protein
MSKKQKVVVELSEQEQAALSGGQSNVFETGSGKKVRTGQGPGNSQSGPPAQPGPIGG